LGRVAFSLHGHVGIAVVVRAPLILVNDDSDRGDRDYE
jgi:hypothetical protein